MWQNPGESPSSSVVEELDSDELDLERLVSLIVGECGCETFSVGSVPGSDTCVCPACCVQIWECGAKVTVSSVFQLSISLIVVCAFVVSGILPWIDDDPYDWTPEVFAEKTCEVDDVPHFP